MNFSQKRIQRIYLARVQREYIPSSSAKMKVHAGASKSLLLAESSSHYMCISQDSMTG